MLADLEPLREGDDGERRRPEPVELRGGQALDSRAARKVAEVAYDQMEGNTEPWSRFRHAVKFVRWRPDRDPKSCTFAQLDVPLNYDLSDVLESVMASAAEELDVDGVKVRLTNPDKVYFPKLGSGARNARWSEYYLAVGVGSRC